jgi:protein phosphatase
MKIFSRVRPNKARGRRGVDAQFESLIETGYATATGARTDNEDRCEVSPRWAIIADGAGGHAGGALAADLTVRVVGSLLESSDDAIDESLACQALVAANAAVRSQRASDPGVAQMASTITMAVAMAVSVQESSWIVLNVGDSPAWLCTSNALTRLTETHNLAADLVRSKVISSVAARHHPGRNTITRAIGTADTLGAHTSHFTLNPGERLIVASDGLEALSEEEIFAVVRHATTATGAARRLVDAALSRGATDNVTVAVLRHRRSDTVDAGVSLAENELQRRGDRR